MRHGYHLARAFRLTPPGAEGRFRLHQRVPEHQAAMSIVDQIEDTLDVIRPALREDGGDVEVVGFDDGVVQLRLVGACSACPISTMTVKQGIERRIKSAIPEVREVMAV
jgi:Fe-S cluster biogenesis protein NfuA